jgi:hypothetical protein
VLCLVQRLSDGSLTALSRLSNGSLQYTAWFKRPCRGKEPEVAQLKAFYMQHDPANARDAGPLVARYPLGKLIPALKKRCACDQLEFHCYCFVGLYY